MTPPVAVALAVPLAGLGSAGLIVLLRPLLARYALARPNARSSHRAPTPQGAGAAVLAAGAGALVLLGGTGGLGMLGAAALALAVLGAVDDVRPLGALPRLALQAAAVGAVVAGSEGRLLPEVPAWLEGALSLLAGLWFVNLVNFVDGLDWVTVA